MDDGNDCQCDSTYLNPSEFALCAAESTCRLDCQRQGWVAIICLILNSFFVLSKKKFNVSPKVRLLTSSCLCSAKPPGTAWAGSACAAPTLTTPCRQSSTISRPTSRLSPLYCTHIMENILLRTYLLNKHAFARIINGKMC